MTGNPRPEPIEAQVVLVFSQREVLLDKGPADGVELGMRFTIIGWTTVKNSSGNEFKVSVPKGTVKIVRFENDGQNAVGRTFKTIKGTPRLGSLAAAIAQFDTSTPDRVETLAVEPGTSVRSTLADGDEIVREGDRAIETRGDEYGD